MTALELFERLGLAFAIGLLFGVERGWQEREAKPGARAAGIRTFTLIGLLGGVWGLLAQVTGEVVLGLAALGFACWFGFFQWREIEAAGSRSATGFVTGLLAFALGAYSILGSKAAAGSVAVAATFILAERRALHGFLERLKWVELRAALMLLVMTFVLLPVLPDRAVDPWGSINPHQLWLLSILTAGISYAGYLAIELAGARNGLLYAGAAGGLVSSTTVTWTFARMSRQGAQGNMDPAVGVLASWAVSLIRMTAIATALAPALAFPLGAPVAAAAGVTAMALVLLYRRSILQRADIKLALTDPFDIWTILQFTAVLAVVMLAAKLLSGGFGEGSLLGLAALSGLADVDPITLSMARDTGTTVTASYAAIVILVAAAANLVAKCALAVFFGGTRFAAPLIATAALGILAAGSVVLVVR
ncbi:MAG TPA: DUF4010 domain-containing protein [Rhizomicrobium sp.]|nr:DUF4010 domain-containing protein [Rhizomicrobium sp.]